MNPATRAANGRRLTISLLVTFVVAADPDLLQIMKLKVRGPKAARTGRMGPVPKIQKIARIFRGNLWIGEVNCHALPESNTRPPRIWMQANCGRKERPRFAATRRGVAFSAGKRKSTSLRVAAKRACYEDRFI